MSDPARANLAWADSDAEPANTTAPALAGSEWAQAILDRPAAAQRRIQQTPVRRIAQPQEIALVAFSSCERKQKFHHRQTIEANGGTLISGEK